MKKHISIVSPLALFLAALSAHADQIPGPPQGEVEQARVGQRTDYDKLKLDVTTDDWEEKLDPLVRQIIDKAYTAQLPKEVEEKLRWLGDGDMVAAQQILRASQAEEGRIMVATLRDEFRGFETVLSARHLKPKVTHVLEFPYGSIRLNIKRSNGRNG